MIRPSPHVRWARLASHFRWTLQASVVLAVALHGAQASAWQKARGVADPIVAPSKIAATFDHPTLLDPSNTLPFLHRTNTSFGPLGSSWEGWTLTGSSGIATQGSNWGSPQGGDGSTTYAFLQGTNSSMSADLELPAGHWRVSFDVARRLHSTSATGDRTFKVEVTHSGQTTEVDSIDTNLVGTDFERRTSDVFTVDTGGAAFPTTIKFVNRFVSGSGDKSNLFDAVVLERVERRMLGQDELEAGTVTFDGDFEVDITSFMLPNNGLFVRLGGTSGSQQGPWEFVGGSGIVNEAVSYIAGMTHADWEGPTQPPTGAAPSGTRAVYLQGANSALRFSGASSYPRGTYRLRYSAGLRHWPANPQDQSLEITVSGATVAATRLIADADDPLDANRTLGMDQLERSTFRTWTTRPFELTTASALDIEIQNGPNAGDNSILLDNVRIERLAEWSDGLTWTDDLSVAVAPGATPKPTDGVGVLAGVVVALDGAASPVQVAAIDIEGEVLVADVDMALEAERIDVAGPGAVLEIGRSGAPYTAVADIYLIDGSASLAERRLMAMDGGRVDLHGGAIVDNDAVELTSWTNLSRDALGTDTSIFIEGEHHWDDLANAAGGPIEVLLVTSMPVNHRTDFVDRSVVLPVVSATVLTGTNETELTLAPGTTVNPLGVDYEGDEILSQAVPSGIATIEIDRRTEVALLTRNIRVHSEAVPDGVPSPHGLNMTGAHVMIMKCDQCDSGGGFARFSGVEFTELGQTGELGRYPVHWHMLFSEGDGQFIRGCSVHETFNRAITVHGTNHVVVNDNVTYNNLGHAYFLEDASERFTVFHHNLGVLTQRPTMQEAVPNGQGTPLDHDFIFEQEPQNRSPATFWITNPQTHLVGNVAAGSNATGYWFALPSRVIGLSLDSLDPEVANMVPRFLPLGAFGEPVGVSPFRDNKAHGLMMAFDIGDGLFTEDISVTNEGLIRTNVAYAPRTDSNMNGSLDPEDDIVRQTFGPFTVHGCESAIYSSASPNSLRFTRIGVANVRRAFDIARENTLIDESITIVAPFDAGGAPQVIGNSEHYAGLMIYDGPARFHDVGFHGFNYGNRAATLLHLRGANLLHTNSTFDEIGFTDLGGQLQRRMSLGPLMNFLGNHVPSPLPFNYDPQYLYSTSSVKEDPQNLENPRKWGAAVLDAGEDGTGAVGSGRTLIDSSTVPGTIRTITVPHRWMLTEDATTGAILESQYINPGEVNPSNLYLTESIFGHFAMRHIGANGPVSFNASTGSQQPEGDVTRHFRSSSSSILDLTMDYDYQTGMHWMFPMMLNRDVEYSIDYTSNVAANIPPINPTTGERRVEFELENAPVTYDWSQASGPFITYVRFKVGANLKIVGLEKRLGHDAIVDRIAHLPNGDVNETGVEQFGLPSDPFSGDDAYSISENEKELLLKIVFPLEPFDLEKQSREEWYTMILEDA